MLVREIYSEPIISFVACVPCVLPDGGVFLKNLHSKKFSEDHRVPKHLVLLRGSKLVKTILSVGRTRFSERGGICNRFF